MSLNVNKLMFTPITTGTNTGSTSPIVETERKPSQLVSELPKLKTPAFNGDNFVKEFGFGTAAIVGTFNPNRPRNSYVTMDCLG